HEFTSFVLALLQVSGRAPKVEDAVIKRIQAIKQLLHFETYVSLTCHNCPDVVQALNTMAVLNPTISHTMVEGGMFRQEVEDKKIMAVP
ncbi:alkyl hydroperoxide reductase subunit F, partial [Corynebacterium aurimucosum]|nr:alkyl hydroperoxide reductase subunit F [Corynebacterium aurimucosum]